MESTAADPERRLPLEPAGREFPYLGGSPYAVSTSGWLVVIAGAVAGFLALVTPLPFTDTLVTGWLRVLLFVGLPLLALRMASPSGWTSIFAPVGFREVKLMFTFALINIVITMAVGATMTFFGTTASNAGVAEAANLSGAPLSNFFARVGVQLLGEELMTILPFLAMLVLFRNVAFMDRSTAVVVAWLASAAVFGLVHLPTYDWNLMQCLVVIGSARLVLTWAYVWSKNLWVSTGAHVINDWTLIASMVFLAPLATSA
jgi:membrane protease YdiL (CAAX protease family)